MADLPGRESGADPYLGRALVTVWATVSAAVVLLAWFVLWFNVGIEDQPVPVPWLDWMPLATVAAGFALWFGRRKRLLGLAVVSLPGQAALWMYTLGPWAGA